MNETNATTLAAGIGYGLSAALFQALSYVLSRRFLTECRSSSTRLFGMSQLLMGVVALLLVPVLLGGGLPPFSRWIWPLLGASMCFMFGQWMMFMTLKSSDSSLLAPLLGFKIPILALFTALVYARNPSLLGWLAIAGCVTAGLLISPPSGIPEIRTLLLMIGACLGYCGSDICIPLLIKAMGTAGNSRSPVLAAVCVTYLYLGLIGLIMVLKQGTLTDRQVIRYAFPHALVWLLAMVLLYACFAHIGIVAGNMLQATRGIFAVAMGMLITRAGWLHLDNVSDRRVLLRRLGGAVLMTSAIILYLKSA